MPVVLIVFLILAGLFCITAFFGAPYVPSQSKEVRKVFKNLYTLGKDDLLIDLGSGDGKVLKIAHEFGARSIGIELNPILAIISKIRLGKKAKVVCNNFFSYDFPSDTTVVYVFGDGRDIDKIVRCIEKQSAKIGHPIYLISHAFKTSDYKIEKAYRAYFLYKIKEK